MADKTLGFKVTEELYDKAKQIIEQQGTTSKEWFEQAVALYEVHQAKETASDFKPDLEELEHHTQRIYALVANMMERSTHLKQRAIQEEADRAASKDQVIHDLQKQLTEKEEALQSISQSHDSLNATFVETEEVVTQLKEAVSNKQSLIDLYVPKLDILQEKLEKQQAEIDTIDTLKSALYAKENELLATTKDFEKDITSLQNELKKMENQKVQLEVEYAQKLDMALAKQELVFNQKLMQIEREHQQATAKIHFDYNEQIRNMLIEQQATKNTSQQED